MKTKTEPEAAIFSLDGIEWRVRLSSGAIVPASWNSRGAAIAGQQVEQRRLEALRCKLATGVGFVPRKKT